MDASLERLVWERAADRCEYCQTPQQADVLPFHIDHIIARQHGGETAAGDLALACYACNLHKGANLSGRFVAAVRNRSQGELQLPNGGKVYRRAGAPRVGRQFALPT
jgi:5-methylcytosine-specific restriction endonuclease McrA